MRPFPHDTTKRDKILNEPSALYAWGRVRPPPARRARPSAGEIVSYPKPFFSHGAIYEIVRTNRALTGRANQGRLTWRGTEWLTCRLSGAHLSFSPKAYSRYLARARVCAYPCARVCAAAPTGTGHFLLRQSSQRAARTADEKGSSHDQEDSHL